jgi:PAS domain S-box-containing protein
MHELRVHQVELETRNQHLLDTQRELEASRNRFRALFDGAPFGYVTLENGVKILEANATAATLLRFPPSGLVGFSLPALMDERDADRFYLATRAASELGTVQVCDVTLQCRDGGAIEARLEIAPDLDGVPKRFHLVMVDITDLRHAQREVETSEARFRELAQHIEHVFYVCELDGRVSYASPAFETIWGHPTGWLEGRVSGWVETIEPIHQQGKARGWARLREGSPINETYRIRRPDGTSRWVQDRAFPVAKDGNIAHYVGVVRDVTRERELEEALRHAQKMEAVGELASGLAHNLGNVLQAILISVRLAQVASDDKKRTGVLERAATSTLKGATLIAQLMTFARKQRGKIDVRPVRIDDWLREAIGLLKPLLGDAIIVDLQAAAPAAVVMADPVQLEQVLLNLASNARDAMPEGGSLVLRSQVESIDDLTAQAHGARPGAYALVSIQDDGSGMDAKTMARIFEPFFTTKEIGAGTGLGLSTAFALVSQFGGWIEVESENNVGTTFSIYLPCDEGG